MNLEREELYSEIRINYRDHGKKYILERYELRDVFASTIYNWLWEGKERYHAMSLLTYCNDDSISIGEYNDMFKEAMVDIGFDFLTGVFSDTSGDDIMVVGYNGERFHLYHGLDTFNRLKVI